jgi:S1-C subfamily serine protease
VAGTPRPRASPWVIGGATVCFVLFLVAAGVMVTTTGDAERTASPTLQSLIGQQSPTTEADIGQLPSKSAVKTLVGQIVQSTVAVISTGVTRTTESSGLVVASGVIVTTAPQVPGARSITVVEYNGTRRTGEILATDRWSGLTLIGIPDDLVAAAPSTSEPSAGSVAMAMALEPGRSAQVPPVMSVYAGRVVSTGSTVIGDKETETFTSTAIDAPVPGDDIGCPLVDAQGHVAGLLESVTGSNGAVISVFLPAQLVFAVAGQLLASGTVNQGSLGVRATDARSAVIAATTTVGIDGGSAMAGARLVSVDRDGPGADAGLQAGDVITAVGGAPVGSLAELETRLYADPPGTTVSLSILRDGSALVRQVTLGTGDSDGPDGDPPVADAPAVSSSP